MDDDNNDNDNNITFPYDWNLSDGYPAKGVPQHNHTVMSTFACGGGSTMGYKLAGYKVIAANDIDKQMAKIYQENHHPDKFYLCPVKDLLSEPNLPKVDVLDGSPPCSTFSMAGSRQRAWGVKKKFREGQARQELDKLFFDFIDLTKKISPPVVIAENVEGIVRGKAIKYARTVVERLERLGYHVDVFLCDGSVMGLPQARRRVFFIGNKLGKKLSLKFNQKPVLYKDIRKSAGTPYSPVPITELYLTYWHEARQGTPVGKFMAGGKKLALNKVPFTLTSAGDLYDALYPRLLYKEELDCISSFPHDYNYLDANMKYVQGMSVPPVMMAQVAYQVYRQIWGE